MIETFKIMSGIYDKEVTDGMLELDANTRTGGHEKKLKKMQCKLNIRKYSFANRIIDTWNSLPNEVIAVKTVKQFEISPELLKSVGFIGFADKKFESPIKTTSISAQMSD